MKQIKDIEVVKRLVEKNGMALLYFGNETCGVCRVMRPKVENLLEEYPNLAGAYVDAGDALELSAAYSIFTLPALLVFAEGKEVIREARHFSFEDITARVDRYYGLLFG